MLELLYLNIVSWSCRHNSCVPWHTCTCGAWSTLVINDHNKHD